MQNDLDKKIEALLFYTAEPVKVKELVKILNAREKDIVESLERLEAALATRGLRLVQREDEFLLTTAPEYSDIIESLIKEERERTLGRAGLETLSIIAYKGPISKKEIEYIRGVNSDYALRTLLLRGLIEKDAPRGNERGVVYTVTFDMLQSLGIRKIEDLPEYAEVHTQLEAEEEEEKKEDEH